METAARRAEERSKDPVPALCGSFFLKIRAKNIRIKKMSE